MSRATTLPEPWSTLAEKLGGVQALADKCQASRWTIARWAQGETVPPAFTREFVRRLALAHDLPNPWAQSQKK